MSKKHSGFTLVELLIVIAIISILTGIGMANYFGLSQESQVKTMAERIVSDMRATVSKSASQQDGQQWGMHFDNTVAGQGFYSIWYGPTYATGTTTEKTSFAASTIQFTTPASGTSTDIIFTTPYGLPSASTTIVISSGGISYEVTIDANGTIGYAPR